MLKRLRSLPNFPLAVLLMLFALALPLSASATVGLTQKDAGAADGQPVSGLSVTFKHIPTVTIEEIVVTLKQSFSTLRAQIDIA